MWATVGFYASVAVLGGCVGVVLHKAIGLFAYKSVWGGPIRWTMTREQAVDEADKVEAMVRAGVMSADEGLKEWDHRIGHLKAQMHEESMEMVDRLYDAQWLHRCERNGWPVMGRDEYRRRGFI